MKWTRIFFPPEVHSLSSRKCWWRLPGVRRRCLGVVHKKMTQPRRRSRILMIFQELKTTILAIFQKQKSSKLFFLKKPTYEVGKRAAPHSQSPAGHTERCCTKKSHDLDLRGQFLRTHDCEKPSKNHRNPSIKLSLKVFLQ